MPGVSRVLSVVGFPRRLLGGARRGAIGTAMLACSCVAYEPAPARSAPPPKTYAVQLELAAEEYVPGLPDRSDALSGNVKAVLQKGKRVGILPPDSCLTTKAGVSADQSDLIRMDCGVLMSSLEVRLAQAGYQVVSWQVLKPIPGQSGIDRARAQNLDVLFEIDQFSAGKIEKDSELSVKLHYLEMVGGAPQPIEATPQVREQCRAVARAAASQARRAMQGDRFEGVLSAKAVDVSSGTAVWYYQKSIADLNDKASHRSATILYDAPGHLPSAPPVKPEDQTNTMQLLGIIFTPLGGGVAGAGVAFTQLDSLEDAGMGMIIGGLASAGLGVLFITLGDAQMRRDNEKRRSEVGPPATYPSAGEVICRTPGRPLAPPSAAPQQTFGGADSSDEYVERSGPARDTEAKRRSKITERIADDFASSLQRLVTP